MADLTDVTAYLAQQAANAVYPNSTASPSVANMDCRISEGWPSPAQLDLDMAGKMKGADGVTIMPRPGGPVANVSIFPMLGTGVNVYQNLDHTWTIKAPVYGLTFSVDDAVITVEGQPATGEYLTLVIDNNLVCSQGGATTADLLAALAAEAQSGGYAGASAADDTLTIPGTHSLTVRQGGTGILGKATHRQRQSIMVTVWAPNQTVRASLAKAIDVLIKSKIRISLPDTSQATVLYNRTNTIDEQQSQTIYRRDLIYDVEYATVEEFVGYVITATKTSIAKPDNSVVATATA